MNRTNQEHREYRLVVKQRELDQREFVLANSPPVTPTRTYVNNTTSGLYTGHSMLSARAGADDHQQHKSLGHRAQVQVRTA